MGLETEYQVTGGTAEERIALIQRSAAARKWAAIENIGIVAVIAISWAASCFAVCN